MPAKPLSTLSIALPLILGGCSGIDWLRFTAAEITGRAILIECSLSSTARGANLAAINGWLASNVHQPRAIALDCDGDGQPDL